MPRLPDLTIRRGLAGFLLVATTINYVDRQTLSVLAPVLQKELSITTLEYAYIVNSFLAVYSVMYLLGGRIVDRVGTRRALGYGIVWWSLAEILHGWMTGFRGLCLARALLAVGEAAIIPSGVKAVAEWFTSKERGLAVGTFEIGLSLGPIIAPPLVVWISLQQGWRHAFFWTGLAGLIWAVPWLLFYRAPNVAPQGPRQNAEDRDESRRASWRELFRSREVWALGLGRFFGDPVWYFYLFWLPKYLSDAKGLSLTGIAAFAWTPYLASLLGGLAGGALSGWLIQRGWETVAARRRVLLWSSVIVSSGVLSMYMESIFLVMLAIGAAAFAMQSWGVTLDTLPGDLFPPERVGQVVGLCGFLGAIGGVAFTSLTGYIVQHYSYAPIWVASAMMYPAGLLCLRILMPARRGLEVPGPASS